MARQMAQHGLVTLLVILGLAMPATHIRAQEATPPPSEQAASADTATTQPSSSSDTDRAIQRLQQLREEARRKQAEQAAAQASGSAPVGAPAPATRPRPSIEELRARAQASTQRATPAPAPAVQPVGRAAQEEGGEEIPDDFVGPPLRLSRAASAPASVSSAPAAGPAAESAPVAAAPSAPLAAESEPEDGRTEWFNFVKTPWEDVLMHFVERIGKPLMTPAEDLAIGGELTYVTHRKFTKEEALDELNLIMYEKGYRFVETENHIRIIPISEMRQWVPVKDTYPSIEAFEAAEPRDMDFVVVYYQVTDQPAKVYVDMFFESLSDGTLMTALPDSNQIKIVGLARDVRKFMALKDRVSITPQDPRRIKIFDIKTNARNIEQLVRNFLQLSTPQPQMRMVRDPRTGQMTAQPVPAAAPAQSEVLMIPDERTNSIVVKATEDKIQEIGELIQKFDQKPDIGNFYTRVIEIQHADAREVATLLQNILQQEQTQLQMQIPNWQWQRQLQLQQQLAERARRRGQPVPPQPQPPPPMQPMLVGVNPDDIFAEGIFERARKTIKMVADARTNSLIVYANDEGFKRVEEMLEIIDKPLPDKFQVIRPERARVSEIAPLLTQLVAGLVPTSGRSAPSVTPDEANNVFYVIAERDEMEKVEDLIRLLDVAPPELERHVVELANLRPSQVAQLVQSLLTSPGGAAPVTTPRGPRGRPGIPVPTPAPTASRTETFQIIPLDEAQILIVYCRAEDWEKIEKTIQMWDERARTSTPRLETFTITRGSAQAIAATLTNLYRSYEHPALGRSPVSIQADGDKVYVYAIQPALEEIAALIQRLDVESPADKVEILPLVNADAAQVAQQLQSLFGARAGGPRLPGVPAGPVIQAEPATNSLIVQADKADLERIKDFALRIDQSYASLATEQRFYTMRYASPQEVAQAVQNIFGGVRAGPRGLGGVAPIKAMAAGSQVIVEAPKDKFGPIEAFIRQLDDPAGKDMVTKMVRLPGCDVNQVAQTMSTTVGRWPARPDRLQATFIPDATTESVIVSAPQDMWPKIDELMEQFRSVAEELTPVTITPQYVDANQLAQTIQTMFRSPSGRAQDVQVSVSGGQLVVKATQKKLDEIQALVAQLDSPDPTGGIQVRTYDLKVLNAVQVQAQVQLFLAQRKQNLRPGQLAPGAFAEPTTNTLVVLAPADILPVVDSIIQELEGKTPPSGKIQAYALKNARADQMANNVDAMLKVKVAEKEGLKKGTILTGVFADPASNRLFVLAPDEYQKLAAELIRLVDEETEVAEIVHIVPLSEGDAQQVAQSLTQIVQGRAAGKGAPVGSVRIAADAGSNSLIISGLPKDVAEAERWIADLEVNSVRVPELQTFTLKYANASDVEKVLKNLFGSARSPQDAVTITPDEYTGRLIVTANRRKMRQVEKIVAELDQAPPTEEEGLVAGGKQIYFVEINRGDAADIAWDVRQQFPDEDKGGPKIESDWYGEYITVKCRESEFPAILKLIREYERRARVETKVVTLKPRGDAQKLLAYLQARHEFEVVQPAGRPEEESIVEEVWKDGEEPAWLRQRRTKTERENQDSGGGRVAPVGGGLSRRSALLEEIERDIVGLPNTPPPRSVAKVRLGDVGDGYRVIPAVFGGAAQPAEDRPAPGRRASTPVESSTSAPRVLAGDEATEDEKTIRSPFEKQKPKVAFGPGGSLVIQGPKEQVDDLKNALELLEEDLAVGEVIRIFHFKYGDVSAAAEILSMMFDVQQRQIVIPQPQPQQRGQPGRPGEEGREGREGVAGGIMEQLRGMVGGRQTGAKGAGPLRIATDPGHNYLIIKCQETQLPEIRRLLRELDIPPGEVQVKIFQLKNLLAEETAENIKDVLGISKVQQRRGARTPTPRAGQPGSPQQQLMEMLQQQLVSVPGVEGGAKVERVEIVPNATTNSLLVSAPPEVMGLIEKVITDLETLEGRDVVGVHYYPLKNARADDILPLLQDIFDAAASGRAEGRPGRGGVPRPAGGTSPASLGPVMVSADPRTNTIVYTAQAKDVPVIEEQIRRLDLPGSMAEAEMYICRYGDAEAIAEVLQAIFAPGGRAGRGGRLPAAGETGAAGEVRIVADSATNAILVWGPPDKRDLIFTKITELDRLSQRDIREIPIVHADPVKLADTLMEVFGGQGAPGQPRSGRRAARPAGAGGAGGANVLAAGRIVILGDRDAKKLLVRAPDEVFRQIEDLVTTLDQPSEQLKLKRFELRYADAETVVESVKQAMTEYIQLAKTTGTETDFDAFTAVPDPRTNSVMVVGSDKTFLFVSQILAAVDIETPDTQRKEFRVFLLERADAATVAEAINGFATGGAAGTAGGGRPGRGRGAAPGAPTGGREINVFAIADEATNSVMVYGRSEDIDRVEEAVIARLEESIGTRYQIATVPVQNVPPSQIVGFIWQFIEPSAAGGGQTGRGTGRPAQGAENTGPQIVPNDSAKTLIVRGTKRQIDEVRELVQRFDDPEVVQQRFKVIRVPYGHDAVRLASEVERIVNDSEAADADRSGRPAQRVTVGADEYTNTLIPSGDPRLVAQVETIVQQLTEVRAEQPVTLVLELQNLPAADAERVITELQRKQAAGGTGRSGVTRPGGGARPSGARPSGGGSTGGTSTPRRSTTPPSTPRRPSGGGGGSRGGGGTPPALDLEFTLRTPTAWGDWSVRPAAWVTPVVATTPLSPVIGLLMAGPGSDDRPAARAATTRPTTTPPTTTPRAPRTTALPPTPEPPARGPVSPSGPIPRDEMLNTVEDDVAGPPESEPADLLEGLSGVTGALRGEVVANAIDDRKIIITGDAADVEFIQRVLKMMDATKAPSIIEVFTLEKAKAAALAPIIDKAVKARLDAAGRKDRFSVNAEGRSNSLIVSASRDVMDEIAELVARLDVVRAGETTVRRVPLVHIRASEAVATLQPTIEKLNKMREVPPESQASVQAIDRDNSVMIIGTPADLDEIEKWFEALDVEISAEKQPKSFVRADAILIQLKNAQAEDVAKVINDMIKQEQEAALAAVGADAKKAGKPAVKTIKLRLPDGTELPELQLEYPIRLVPEKGTNSLIVFSTPDNNSALQAIVGVFDSLPVGAETDVKAFALQYANAEEVSKLLTDLFKDKSPLNRPSEGSGTSLQKGVMPPVPPGVAARGLPYPVTVQHDPRSNVVIVVGRSDAVLLAAGLIRELDRPTVELGLQAHVLELKHTQAGPLAEKLKKLLDDRAKALKGDKNAARDSAVIQPEERSNALIVLATAEVYEMVEDLVLQLDAAQRYSVVDTRFRPLQFADAVKLQAILDEMFKARKDAEKAANKDATDTLSVLADARSNALLLTGTRDYLAEAERVIGQLDQEFEGTVVFRACKVRLNSAANIATLLKDMIDKALKQQDSKLKGSPIHVSADPVSDTLLLAASREDMQVLERWVEILDRPSEVGRMTRIIPLRQAVADDVAKAVGDIFKKQAGGTGGKGGEIDITVTADKTTNSVVAFGPPALLVDVEDFVRQLDSTEARKGAVVRIFKLTQADAQEAGDLLSRILDLRGGSVGGTGGGATGGSTRQEAAKQVLLIFQREHPEVGMETLKGLRSDIVVISDLRTNSLVVTAPPESMPLMESLVAAIDVPPEAARIRVFRLRNSDAEQMVKLLDDIFKQQTRTGTTRGGTTGEPERVLTFGEGVEGGRQEIAFATDVRTNSVIAAGTPGYLDLVEQMILELDTVPIKDREVIVYSPRNNKADVIVPSIKEWSDAEQKRLQDIGEDVSVGVKQERMVTAIANKDANRVILSVDPRFRDTVMRVVRDLDQPPPQVLIQVLILEVTMDNSLDLGVEFAFQDLQYAKAGPTDTTTFDFVGGTDIGAVGSGLGGFTFTITGADFNFLFRTLQSEGNLRVLSRPQIVAMDNQKAKIDISNDVPYVTGTQTSSTGQISTSVGRQKVGITLEVTPQINPDGFVRMEINQKVSDLTGSTVDVGPGVTAPIFFTREAETTITVQDNETVVLGGLITSRTENREQKVPLVGDIPGLGLLFRNQNDTSRRVELLLVLTPHVIRTPDEFRALSEAERDQHELLPQDVLESPLMQGLRVVPSEEQVPPESLTPSPAEPGESLQESLEPKEEEYGPLRPALRVPPADADSYDVPLTARLRGRR